MPLTTLVRLYSPAGSLPLFFDAIVGSEGERIARASGWSEVNQHETWSRIYRAGAVRTQPPGPTWVTDRLPLATDEGMSVAFKRDDYEHYSGTFWVWNGREVTTDRFEIPPGYSGYWSARTLDAYDGLSYLAWMVYRIPAPPAGAVEP